MEVFAFGDVELLVLVWQDRHLIRVVALHGLPVLANLAGDAILDIVLQLVVSLFEFVLLALLVAYLDGQALLLAILRRQVVAALRDAPLRHLVQHLELIE